MTTIDFLEQSYQRYLFQDAQTFEQCILIHSLKASLPQIPSEKTINLYERYSILFERWQNPVGQAWCYFLICVCIKRQPKLREIEPFMFSCLYHFENAKMVHEYNKSLVYALSFDEFKPNVLFGVLSSQTQKYLTQPRLVTYLELVNNHDFVVSDQIKADLWMLIGNKLGLQNKRARNYILKALSIYVKFQNNTGEFLCIMFLLKFHVQKKLIDMNREKPTLKHLNDWEVFINYCRRVLCMTQQDYVLCISREDIAHVYKIQALLYMQRVIWNNFENSECYIEICKCLFTRAVECNHKLLCECKMYLDVLKNK